MSKTVTIPSYKNPYDVDVNGRKYAYRAGDTLEVPDEVAEVIEHDLDLVIEPLPVPKPGGSGSSGGGGGESAGSDTLTWDGNTEGLAAVDIGDGSYLYKISDATPTLSEAQQGGKVTGIDGSVAEFTSADIASMNDVYTIANMVGGLVVLKDNTDFYGVTIPQKGIYYLSDYIATLPSVGFLLTINGYTGFPAVSMEEQFIRLIERDESKPVTKLPDGVTKIGAIAFAENKAIALTAIPDGVTSIGNKAFQSCYNLALTSLPASVTSIGNYAFQSCYALTEITFNGKPDSIGTNVFLYCSELYTINVPWAEGEVANAPWGASYATINYNYTGG